MADDFMPLEPDPPRRPVGPVPWWLHTTLTIIAVLLWAWFCAAFDMPFVVVAGGVIAILGLRRLDWRGL